MPVPMVGRAAAVDELRHAWARVTDGGRGVPAVITGAPGTGKSTLVTAVVQAAQPGKVLTGSARVHSPAPYDWLAAVLAAQPVRDVPVPPDALAWLAQEPDVPRERYTPDALLRLAVTTVRALVGAGPAVLVVEDLHALDPASLNLVAELAAADLPALLLVTSQPPEVAVSPELAARTLARLAGAPGAVRRHLGALAAADVAQILQHVYADSVVPGDLAESVWRRTGGNPYRLTELLAVEGADGPEALAVPLPKPGPSDGAVPLPKPGPSDGAVPLPKPGPSDGAVPLPKPGPSDGAENRVPGVGQELTAREREVLGCLAEGMSNKQIARALGISVRTVTVHVSNLLRKTGSASRTEAALLAVRATAAS
jgi:DNA-binding CsgD family transcriptional regulator